MYVLVAVISKSEMAGPVVKRLKELGIKGATILDSMGSGRFVERENTRLLIGGLRHLDGGDITHNKTVFCIVESREQTLKAADEIERLLGGDMTVPGTGIVFSLPVDMVRGGELGRYMKERERNNQI